MDVPCSDLSADGVLSAEFGPVPLYEIVRLAASVQPLVFELDIDGELSYSTAGTVFLVRHEDRAFVVTTRHSLHPEDVPPVCVFPSDHSLRLLPLKDVFFVPADQVDDDFADLAIIEIDTTNIVDDELNQATVIDLQLALGGLPAFQEASDLVVLGYPDQHSCVDYERETLTTGRVALRCRYVKPSSIPYVHELEVLDGDHLNTFRGLSGAPVFGWIARSAQNVQIIFCGVALRGTTVSQRIHFLDRSILMDALKVKCAIQ